MDAIAFVRAPFDNFVHEDDTFFTLLDGDVVVDSAWDGTFELGELPVVCGKECFGLFSFCCKDVFGYRPGDGDTVEMIKFGLPNTL